MKCRQLIACQLAIDICCETNKRSGLIGLDAQKTDNVDIVSDSKLPFRDSCFDLVLGQHVIEHLSHREIANILQEWARVPKIGGEIENGCPDFRLRALIFF